MSATSRNNVWLEKQLSTYKHSFLVYIHTALGRLHLKTFIKKIESWNKKKTLSRDLVPNYGMRYRPSCAHFQNTNSNLIFVSHTGDWRYLFCNPVYKNSELMHVLFSFPPSTSFFTLILLQLFFFRIILGLPRLATAISGARTLVKIFFRKVIIKSYL